MSLSNTTVKQTYNGNGSTTDFAIPFTIIADDSAEVDVYIRDESDPNAITETLQTEGAMQDYTLTGASPPSTPFHTTVSFNTPPSSDHKVIIIRNLARTQTLDISESGDFPAESLETALDRVVAQVQSLKEELDRIPKLRISEQFGDTTLGQAFANHLIQVNSSNDGFKFSSPSAVFASATGGVEATVEATINNSQAIATDITGLSISSSTHTSAIVFCEIERGTNFNNLILYLQYQNSSWRINEGLGNGEAHGLTFSITSSGFVQYTSDNSGAGTLKYRVLRFEA